jgi:hypothetical protein
MPEDDPRKGVKRAALPPTAEAAGSTSALSELLLRMTHNRMHTIKVRTKTT